MGIGAVPEGMIREGVYPKGQYINIGKKPRPCANPAGFGSRRGIPVSRDTLHAGTGERSQSSVSYRIH